MMLYIPAAAAEPLSAHLWQLSDPAGEGQTHELFGWIDDLQGDRWLVVDTDYTILVHPAAVLDGIADILQPWIDGGQLPADTNAQLEALIESKRGQVLAIYDAFPALFKTMSKTLEQMIAEGKLLNPFA